MLRLTIITCLFLCSCFVQANQRATLYQIDMIVFTHQQVGSQQSSIPPQLMTSDSQHSIPLDSTVSSVTTPYHMLPASSSQLSSEYWALNRKAEYQVLAHYTWLQPSNNQRAIVLPSTNRNGWNIEGTLRIRQSNYYLLDTDLLFTAPNNNQTAFLFSQKQRLKPGTVYYLDHPQAGMLIKVHQIA